MSKINKLAKELIDTNKLQRAQLSVTKYLAIQQGSPARGLVIPSASLDCILGAFLGMFLCDAVGRRKTLVLATSAPDRV